MLILQSLSTSRSKAQSPAAIIELQALLIDHSPQAIAELATTLWYRYHSYENWGGMALDGSVQLLSSLSTGIISSLLQGISERLPAGLEPQLSKWISGLTSTAIITTFGGPTSTSVRTLLLDLVNEGTITSTALVDSVVLPIWKLLLCDSINTKGTFIPTVTHSRALDLIASIFSSLVGSDLVEFSPTPSNLLNRQRSISRRISLHTYALLPNLGRCLAYLVITQELWAVKGEFEKVVDSTKLLSYVGNLAVFQMTVARDPQMLASAILESPTSLGTSSSNSLYRPKLLAALLLILKDGSSDGKMLFFSHVI